MIDIDAIPLDLPVQRQPVVALYLATVETLPDGREVVMPHYGGPVWEWFGKQAPTLAHGPRGQAESKGNVDRRGDWRRGRTWVITDILRAVNRYFQAGWAAAGHARESRSDTHILSRAKTAAALMQDG